MADRSDGGWIVIRPALLNHPNVVAMAAKLAPGLGLKGPTRRYARHVIMTGLVLVWGAANEHTPDGMLPGVPLDGLDDIAGIDGFGAAMAGVGWAEASPDGVTLPRFEEWNRTFKSRTRHAERQKKYRQRHGVTPERHEKRHNEHNDVTPASQSDALNVTERHAGRHKMTSEADAEADADADAEFPEGIIPDGKSNSVDAADMNPGPATAAAYLKTAPRFAGKLLDPDQFVHDMASRFPHLNLLDVLKEAHAFLSAGNQPKTSVARFVMRWCVNEGTDGRPSSGRNRSGSGERTTEGEAGGARDLAEYDRKIQHA